MCINIISLMLFYFSEREKAVPLIATATCKRKVMRWWIKIVVIDKKAIITLLIKLGCIKIEEDCVQVITAMRKRSYSVNK